MRLTLASGLLVAGLTLAHPALADAVTYQYDSLGRLSTATYYNGTVITYTYDAAGNRTAVVTVCSSSGC